MTSGQVQDSESESVYFEDKDNYSSKDKDEDCAQEDSSGNDSSKSESESSSESDSDTDEAGAEEPNEDLGKKKPQSFCAESEMNIQQHCEHCKIKQGQQEQVTPRRLSRGQLWLKLDGEGVYQCTVTGLIFEVTKAAIIEYSLLSWTKYSTYIKEPWIIVGPIFDVKCTTPSVLTSIQFPHTLCLNDHLSDVTFNVFHFKNNGPEFECSVDHSATHIKWNVSSLSPVGPVIEKYDPVYYHGVVILYKVVSNLPSLEFRVYMASNNSSVIKDVSKSVKRSPNTFIKIEKPPCHKLLQGGKKYRLTSDPEADITPEEIEFGDHSSLAEKPFFEVYLEQPMDLTLSLVDLESGESVWKAKLRESDWTVPSQNENRPKRIRNGVRRRKSSTSLSGDELSNKRLKGNDIPDCNVLYMGLPLKKDQKLELVQNASSKSADGSFWPDACHAALKGVKAEVVLTDQQLMILAKKMGKDWKVIGIQCLKLSVEDIEQIQAKEEDINIYKCMMLRKWRDSEQNNGTAQSLYECLKGDASYEVLEILKGFLEQT